MKKIIYFFSFTLILLLNLGCEKWAPTSPSNQGNPAKGTGTYDYEDSNVPCTLTYSIYNNDQYNYTLYFPDATYYIPAYGYISVSLTYAGCATVEVYDPDYAVWESDLSFCPCSDDAAYTIDMY